jgi:hypothetical protein
VSADSSDFPSGRRGPIPFEEFEARVEREFRETRAPLLTSNWLKLTLPPRDYLIGDLLCTTSRWILVGDTGIGKTLFSLDLAAAVSGGVGMLDWQGTGKERRVMYLDGEMPAETFKERIEVVARRYRADLQLWVYNRDVLEDGAMPPLNTPGGEAWLLQEIELIKPDLILFDSIMSLTIGNMAEEESWAPINLLMRKITSMRVAQIWLHHTGHDASRGYGTKTREWQVDTVAILRASEDSDAIELRFPKARLRTPKTFAQFEPKLIVCDENGWRVTGDAPKGKGRSGGRGGSGNSEVKFISAQLLKAYGELADAVSPTPGFAGERVRKVSVDALRDEVRRRGFLETDEKDHLTATDRSQWRRAKTEILKSNKLVERDGLIWRISTESNW